MLKKILRIISKTLFWALFATGMVCLILTATLVLYLSLHKPDPELVIKLRKAVSEQRIAYKLTEPNEMISILGSPTREMKEADGGMEILLLEWDGIEAEFNRMRSHGREQNAFTLCYVKRDGRHLGVGDFGIRVGAMLIDIGKSNKVCLQTQADLKKFDTFWGFAGVSLAKLDLRECGQILDKMPFDSRTDWPSSARLPDGFAPAKMLEEGKYPGLKISALHKKGINGKGIGIAIIDQVLLKEHIDYAGKIAYYQTVGQIKNQSYQMHAPPVVSIAVGDRCGVAPGAKVYYWAINPVSYKCNGDYCPLIREILRFNYANDANIKVISISLGMFSQWSDYDEWKQVAEEANKEGILIVTCDPEFLKYGTLEWTAGKDKDDPNSYKKGRYYGRDDILGVPAGNRTIASHCGTDVFTFCRSGGMSWGAPYLAGLAALAFEVNPDLRPEEIVALWVDTAYKTEAGNVINPTGFIAAIKERMPVACQRKLMREL